MDKEKLIAYVTELVLQEIKQLGNTKDTVPVGISARHVHLSQIHLEILFGKGYELTHLKDLSQPGQFAAQEQVEVIGPKGSIKNIRILGPIRFDTQVEVATSDLRTLGIEAPVRGSGNIQNTPGGTIKGPVGEVTIPCGIIVAERHLHMSDDDARAYELKNNDVISIIVEGSKGGIMGDVVVRANKEYALDLHIDTDDANAFNIKQGQRLKIQRIQTNC